jgi:hypothetical protein
VRFNYFTDIRVREGAGVAQYSVWLRTGRPSDRRSIPGRGEIIFL